MILMYDSDPYVPHEISPRTSNNQPRNIYPIDAENMVDNCANTPQNEPLKRKYGFQRMRLE